MKRILVILATAAIVASCANQDTFIKDIQDDTGAISFTPYTNKQTRAENSSASYSWHFFNHHTTFQVWGYKNTSQTAVFNGEVVTVDEKTANVDGTPATANSYTYTYSPLRFWDKAATTYEYYAAAPSAEPYDATSNPGGWNFVSSGITAANITTTTGQNKGYFETKSVLTPANLSTSSNYAYTTSFKGSSDIDKMIAEKCTVPYANFKTDVHLPFIHILSRLNVTIKADESLVAPAENKNKQKIIMTSLVVKNLKAAGDFSEATAPVAAGTIARWSGQATPRDYTAVENTELTKDAKWVLQSLVIPQNAGFESVALDGKAHDATAAVYYADVDEYNDAQGLKGADRRDATWWGTNKNTEATIKTPAGATVAEVSANSKPYLVLTYTIQQTHDKDGNAIASPKAAEEFKVYYNLANAFAFTQTTDNLAFNEGWQNTLNITIKPDAIQFCADVAEWSTYERGLRVD